MLWFIFLPVISFIITFQVFFFFFWFFYYLILFSYKFIIFKLKFKNINDIFCEEIYKGTNIIFKFFIKIFLEIPKKIAFYYFYNLINFFLVDNFFKNMWVIIIDLIKNSNKNKKITLYSILAYIIYILILFLIKVLTNYPFFVLKINNQISKSFYNLICMERYNFKAFYTNFMFNILMKYNTLNTLKIKDKKIGFDKESIYSNPGSKKISDFLDTSDLNKVVNGVMASTDGLIHRNGASKPMLSMIKKVGDKNMVSSKINSKYIDFEDEKEFNIINRYKFEKFDKFYLKNEPELEKMNTKIKHTISGETFLKEHGDKKIIESINHEDRVFLENNNSYESVNLPLYSANPKDQILIDSSSHIIDIDNLAHIQFNLAKNLIYCYGKYFWLGKFDGGGNYIFEKQDYLTRDFIQQNSDYFKYMFGESVINLERFYKNNSELYNPNNSDQLLNHVNSILTHPLSPSDLNDLINDICREKGISVHDAITTGFIYKIISEIVNGS